MSSSFINKARLYLPILFVLLGCQSCVNNQFFYYNVLESASTEWDLGHYDEAERLYKRALAAAEKMGPNDHRVVDVLEQLSSKYLSIGKIEDARACITRAIKIRDDAKPKHSFEDNFLKHRLNDASDSSEEVTAYARAITILANCDYALSKYDLAEKEYKKAISIFDADTTKNDENRYAYANAVTSPQLELAVCLEKMGRFDKAEDLYKKVIDKTYYGQINIMVALALLYEMKGDLPAANSMYMRALAFNSDSEGRSGNLFNDIGKNQITLEFDKEPENMSVESQSLAMSKVEKFDFQLREKYSVKQTASSRVLVCLGTEYLKLREFDKAEAVLKRALEMYKTQEDELKVKPNAVLPLEEDLECMDALVHTYFLSGKKEEALKLDKEVHKLRKERSEKEKRLVGRLR